MITGEELRLLTEQNISDIFELIEWGDIWERPIDSGTAFEWTCFSETVVVLRENGWTVSFPLLNNLQEKCHRFVLRNEIPLQHRAQAGHRIEEGPVSLQDRFIQSLIPKAVISNGTETYSIFREGYPYHRILSEEYNDRPDIVFAPGAPVTGYPIYDHQKRTVEFAYEGNQPYVVQGALKVRMSPTIPRVSKPLGSQCPVTGIMELSVNKSSSHARNQLTKYKSIFNVPMYPEPELFLLTGNEISEIGFKKASVNLNGDDVSELKYRLKDAVTRALINFGLIKK